MPKRRRVRPTHHGIEEGSGPIFRLPDWVVALERRLRREQTPPEALLWACLRDRSLLGVKFRRQHAIGRYIVDFYAHEAQLAIEVDGQCHDETVDQDAQRDAILAEQGIRVLRFTGSDVLHHLRRVLEVVAAEIEQERTENRPPCEHEVPSQSRIETGHRAPG